MAESVNDLVLRPASRADIAALGPIEQAADERYRGSRHAALLDGSTIPLDAAERAVEQGRITVAVLSGAVVGWLLVGRLGKELCLGQVSVLPSAGRLGVGTALLEDAIARARLASEPSIVLNTQEDFPWCMPWYARHGFVVVPPERWSEDLVAIADAQRAGGLDWSSRVHMRLVLAGEAG
jgi:GNAT superfamily N-acetyltransferase